MPASIWRQCGRAGPTIRIRVRMVEYSPGYVADHWCSKGHIILLCLEGEMETTLEDGRVFAAPGMSYQVADQAEAHRSQAPKGRQAVHRRLVSVPDDLAPV
jgi:uncharacterized cupin superfamily protein